MLESAARAYAAHTASGQKPCKEPKQFRSNRASAQSIAELGDALRRQGKNDIARGKYVEAQKINSEEPIASAGIEALDHPPAPATAAPSPSPSPGPMAIAIGLSRSGYDTQAKDQLQKAIEADPSATVPPELFYLTPLTPGWVRSGAAIATALFPVLLVLLVLLVAALLLPNLIRRRQLELGEFETAAVNDKYKTSIPEVIAGELGRLDQEGAGQSMQFVSGPDPKLELPAELASELPHGKLIGALLAVIPTRKRPYRVQGTAHPRGDKGFGLTISIVDGKGVVTAETIWEDDLDPDIPGKDADISEAAVIHRLGLAAASWLVYHIPNRPSIYLTDDWRSYVAFRVGAAWYEQGDATRAREMYDKSLQFDPSNRGSLFNLAVLDTQPTAATISERVAAYDEAIARYDLARARLEAAHDAAGKTVYLDRLWYRTVYNKAAAIVNRYVDQKTSGSTGGIESLRGGRDEIRGAISLIDKVRQRYPADHPKYGELNVFLGQVRLAMLVILADIVARDARLRVAGSLPKTDIPEETPRWRTRLAAARRAFERGAPV